MALLIALVLLLTTVAGRALGFGRDDEAALVFCGSQKSLVSGVPIASALVSGAAVGPILLPIMLYYPAQILICAWMARRYALGEEQSGSLAVRVVGKLSRTTRGIESRGGSMPRGGSVPRSGSTR